MSMPQTCAMLSPHPGLRLLIPAPGERLVKEGGGSPSIAVFTPPDAGLRKLLPNVGTFMFL